jgi:hypothetical protein
MLQTHGLEGGHTPQGDLCPKRINYGGTYAPGGSTPHTHELVGGHTPHTNTRMNYGGPDAPGGSTPHTNVHMNLYWEIYAP